MAGNLKQIKHLWYNDRISAFQAEDEGLIPSRCSTNKEDMV